MEVISTTSSSVVDYLELCIQKGCHSLNFLENPLIRNYYSNFSYYHGKLIKNMKRYWDYVENSPLIEEINKSNNGNEFIDENIQKQVEWNQFLCIEHSFLDYEKKILNNEI